jgi:hypothetical protein
MHCNAAQAHFRQLHQHCECPARAAPAHNDAAKHTVNMPHTYAPTPYGKMNETSAPLQKKKNPLPPVNWRWVEEGGGYVRHEAWPHTPTVMEKHDSRVSPGTHQSSAIFTRAAASSPRPLVRRRQYLPRRGATGGIRTHDLNRLPALLYQLCYTALGLYNHHPRSIMRLFNAARRLGLLRGSAFQALQHPVAHAGRTEPSKHQH